MQVYECYYAMYNICFLRWDKYQINKGYFMMKDWVIFFCRVLDYIR